MIKVDIDYAALAEELAKHIEPTRHWMTVAGAAEYMQVSERWLRGRLHEIPHCKVDGKTLIDRRELDSWITNHRREN